MMGRMKGGSRNPYTLFPGMKIIAAIIETNMKIPKNEK